MIARFDLTTPTYRLRTRGIARRVSPARWDGAAVADAIDTALSAAASDGCCGGKPIVVGLIPFDSATQAVFCVPADVTWETNASTPFAPFHDGARAGHRGAEPMAVRGGDSPAYRAAVAEALKRIRAGTLDKVVLARRVVVETAGPIDCDSVYARLCVQNRNAYVYRADLPGDPGQPPSVVLGASPELVLGSHRGTVRSLPLAGSAPRAADAVADHEAGQALMRSKKDLSEHGLVVQAVGAAFRRFADAVETPAAPQLVQTPVIWHLGTPVTGMLRQGVSPMELVYALHPTPAVGGWPAAAARKAIADLEDFDRGFYAGLIGWMDGDGNGEWVLVLRGGIVSGRVATVYAGAGIVANSDPEKEHAETATKLRTFISALGMGAWEGSHDRTSDDRLSRAV